MQPCGFVVHRFIIGMTSGETKKPARTFWSMTARLLRTLFFSLSPYYLFFVSFIYPFYSFPNCIGISYARLSSPFPLY